MSPACSSLQKSDQRANSYAWNRIQIILHSNVLKNKLQNVTLPIAVSAEMGKMEMYKDTVSGGRTSSLFQEFVGTHFEGKTETVEVTTFEELIHQLAHGIL